MSSLAKPLIVWSLYCAGAATVVTPFAGVVLAYLWRRDAASPAAKDHDRQIRLFWQAGRAWAIAFLLMGLALYLDIGSGAPVAAPKPLLFDIGLLVGVLAQICFLVASLWHLFRTLLSGPGSAQPV